MAAGEVTTLNLTLTPQAVALNPVVVSASKRQEKAQEAPASVSVVGARQIENRAAVTPAEHIRATPGVDVAQTGIQNANVVVRGFNAAFTSSLSYLTDYRIASVPGLQVNRFGSLSLSNDDIERIEVVLGPGAALYGPNTANGVLHVLSKSPLTYPGTAASVSVGERDVFMGNFRTAHRLNDNLGIKLSGQYFQATEWPFVDTAEVRLQGLAHARLEQFRDAQRARGLSEQQIQDSIARDVNLFSLTRIGVRPDDASRYGVDARIDWNPLPGVGTVFQAGRTSNTSVDLTGISASVQDEFSVTYYQGRLSTGRLFAQVYMEENDAGGTYTARTGAPVIDESRLWVAQLQHGFALLGGRQNFIYGVDWIHTVPESQGTVYGRNEEGDEVTQTGVYLQSETRLLPSLNLVLAGRYDQHSVIEDDVFSPRVGLVFTPVEGQTFRATYNRAFQAPTAINLFLDRLSSQTGPFAVRAIGTGAQGWNFRLDDGRLAFRSPFNPAATGGMNTRLGYDPALVSRLAINVMLANAQALGITPAEAGRLLASNPSFTVIGRNPQTGVLGVPFDPASVENLPGLKPEISEVFEVGYRGLFRNRFLITADVWHLQRENFISQLFAPAPMLLVPAAQVEQFLIAQQFDPANAKAIAGVVGATPIGVVAAAENDVLTGEVPF